MPWMKFWYAKDDDDYGVQHKDSPEEVFKCAVGTGQVERVFRLIPMTPTPCRDLRLF